MVGVTTALLTRLNFFLTFGGAIALTMGAASVSAAT